MFDLVVCDHLGQRHNIGSVKIGQFGTPARCEICSRIPHTRLELEFDSLNEQFFSLGQDDSYYESLSLIPGNMRLNVLRGLRDCAFDQSIFELAKEEEVMTESLLRYIAAKL